MASDLESDGAASAADRDAVEREVAEIVQLDLASLRERWRDAFGNAPPPGLYREFLARALAYHVQAEAFGDLDRDLKLKLAKLAKGDEKALDGHRTRLKPGTILVREWKGTLKRVTVMADGYAWNGQTYASLSAAARAITGTSWNGPAFFGLTSGKKRKARKDGRA